MPNNNNYRKNRSNQNSETSPEMAIVEGIFRVIGQLFMWIFNMIRGVKPGPTGLRAEQRQKIQDGWEKVEMHLVTPATAALAISEGDKLLDVALQYLGTMGNTMGERLKASEKKFSRELYQEIWEAHKIRNTLAHELGSGVSQQEAQQAVATFRKALSHLGVI